MCALLLCVVYSVLVCCVANPRTRERERERARARGRALYANALASLVLCELHPG